MATFVKRPGPRGKPVWQALIRRRGYPQQTRTFDKRSEAEVWAAGIEHEMNRGAFIDRSQSDSTTLWGLLDQYEKEVTPSKRGKDREVSRIGVLKRQPLAQMLLPAITGKAMSRHKEERLKQVSPATFNRELNVLSHVFTVAQKEWHMHLPWGNPVALVRRPKVDDKRERRFLSGEEELLLASADIDQGEPVGEIVRFALETALRRGEIAAMRWEHVDKKARVLLVPETKTGTPRRVPLSSRALTVLDGLVRRIDGRVFAVHPVSISRAFERAVGRAREAYLAECRTRRVKPDERPLSDLRFHDLRHEATSRLFEKGLNPMEVAAITGHKTLQMLKRYTHLRAEDLVERLG
ncbi:MAG: site-specific integrase [Acidiferrobacterales bacterium]